MFALRNHMFSSDIPNWMAPNNYTGSYVTKKFMKIKKIIWLSFLSRCIILLE